MLRPKLVRLLCDMCSPVHLIFGDAPPRKHVDAESILVCNVRLLQLSVSPLGNQLWNLLTNPRAEMSLHSRAKSQGLNAASPRIIPPLRTLLRPAKKSLIAASSRGNR
mmetsp:Transcript_7718/g.12312  ORF Transcript_7718/g.12312 Transcript_7718/m.12312 type:complete len:108 (+) Transcript_7718:428-751(+)